MNSIPLLAADNEIQSFLAEELAAQLIINSSIDESKQIRTLALTILDKLYDNTHSLVVVQNKNQAIELKTELQKINLSQFILRFQLDRNISEVERSELLRANIPNKCISKDDIDLLGQIHLGELESVKQKYVDLKDSIFGNKSILDLIVAYDKVRQFTNEKEKSLDIVPSSLVFTQEEFWSIRKNLQRAIEKYNPIFNSFQTDIHFNQAGKSIDNKSSESIIAAITQVIDNTEDVIFKISDFLDTYLEDLMLNEYKIKEDVIQNFKLIQEGKVFVKYQTPKKTNKLLPLIRKQSINWEPLQSKFEDCIELIENSFLLKGKISLNGSVQDLEIDQLINDIETIQISKTDFSNYLDRLNIHHLPNERKDQLISQIEDKIDLLNKSNLVQENIEISAFTFKHQLTSLADNLSRLKQTRELYIQVPSYIDWFNFRSNQSKEVNAILDSLKNHEATEWIYLFEAWYIKSIIDQNEWRLNSLRPEIFNYSLNVERKILEEKLDYIHNEQSQKREKAKQSFRKNHKQIYKKVSNKGNEAILWHELHTPLNNLVFEFFPITIVDFNTFNQLKEKFLQSSFKDILVIGNQETNFDFILSLKKSFNKIALFQQSLNSSKEDFMDLSATADISCSINNYISPLPIASQKFHDSPISERLMIVKKLSTNLFDQIHQYKVYQTKSHSIVSFLSDHYNHKLESQLEGFNMKEIFASGQNIEGIIEALLDTSKETIVLFEEGLLNSNKPEQFSWQLHLIDCMQQAGVHCFNIWSADIYKTGDTIFNDLRNVFRELEAQNQDTPAPSLVIVNE